MRRVLLATLLAAAVAPLAPAFAQWKPERPIRIVVPFTPGGGTDLQARRIAPALAEALGVAVTVENKPGGGTLIGAREVAKAAPDGTTLLYTVASLTQLPHLHSTPPYDLFRDFTPITPGSLGGTVLVARTESPFSTVREMVDYAKRNPGKLNVG